MTSKYKLPAILVIFLLAILDSSVQTAARQDTAQRKGMER
jgi:hypothetical protein